MSDFADKPSGSVSGAGSGDDVLPSLGWQPVLLGGGLVSPLVTGNLVICCTSDNTSGLADKPGCFASRLGSGDDVLLSLGWQHVPLGGGLVSLLVTGVDLEDLGLILGLDLDLDISSNLRLLAGLSQVMTFSSSLSNLMYSSPFRLTPVVSIRS